MSRIGPPSDRPIPTPEPKVATQQTSETESIQKTDISGKAPLDAEQQAKTQTPATDTKRQQGESRFGGLARQTELQSQFPIASEPTLKNLPDNQVLDRNIHLDEKIDVTKNLPDGHAINSGLEGLDWGPNQAKTGPNHMGVELTTGGMKAPKDVLADVLNGGKGQKPNTSAPKPGEKDDGVKNAEDTGGKPNNYLSESGGTPPPGVELNFRAPKGDLVSAEKPLKEYVPPEPKPDTSPASDLGKSIYDNTMGRLTGKKWDESFGTPDKTKKYIDPDSENTGGQPRTLSPEEVARVVTVNKGDTDFVEGYGGGPKFSEGDKPKVRYGDLVTDGGDTSDTTDVKSSDGGPVIIGGGFTDGPRPDTPMPPTPGGGPDPKNEA